MLFKRQKKISVLKEVSSVDNVSVLFVMRNLVVFLSKTSKTILLS